MFAAVSTTCRPRARSPCASDVVRQMQDCSSGPLTYRATSSLVRELCCSRSRQHVFVGDSEAYMQRSETACRFAAVRTDSKTKR